MVSDRWNLKHSNTKTPGCKVQLHANIWQQSVAFTQQPKDCTHHFTETTSLFGLPFPPTSMAGNSNFWMRWIQLLLKISNCTALQSTLAHSDALLEGERRFRRTERCKASLSRVSTNCSWKKRSAKPTWVQNLMNLPKQCWAAKIGCLVNVVQIWKWDKKHYKQELGYLLKHSKKD